jgi:hypothetical protein
MFTDLETHKTIWKEKKKINHYLGDGNVKDSNDKEFENDESPLNMNSDE